ncbi:MAG: DUF924 domain-containing protein, partial [Myxococcales bacterium]|nr:DUF924 domain-containing protein [Myxococcales bacterium]
TSTMFSADELACEVCCEGLDAGFDAELAFDQRVFFYLPLMHSERMVDQERCLELFGELVATAPAQLKPDAEYYLGFARRHKAIIDQFGRYPHRNEILGRASTPEEVEFLKGPDSSF